MSNESTESNPGGIRGFEELEKEVHGELEQINMGALEEIFQEKLARAGVTDITNRFWGMDRIVLGDGEKIDNGVGGVHLKYQHILLNVGLIALEGRSRDVSLPRVLLSTIAHEETHVAAGGKIYPENSRIISSLPLIIQENGNTRWQKRDGILRAFFNSFNEAVTDKIGEEVYNEYVRRTGERGRFISKERSGYLMSYTEECRMLEIFMTKLSELSGVSKEKVWEAIQGHNLRGDDLRNREFAQLFAEYFGNAFVEMLTNANDADAATNTRTFLEKLPEIEITGEESERLLALWKKEQGEGKQQ